MKKKVNIGIGMIVILALMVAFFLFHDGQKGPQYRTEKISRGDIQATVTATGTVNAVVTVLVGTQVSGTIQSLYVDYNSPVKKGQILAQIDPATFQAQVDQARANLAAAKANVEKAEAALLDARRTLERHKTLFQKSYIARSDLDTAETTEQSARAQVSAAKAQVQQTNAALDYAENNLRYTRIVSPVDGTVISRNVDVGQTVAASFQTPTLFNIAQDLTQMQINTNIDEADIGKIKVDQTVEFTVDAYPEETFTGKVFEVRNAPITVQNVVTYDVVVKVSNPDLKLKPGMTANVSVILEEKDGVLRVPNAALRYKPAGKEDLKRLKGAGLWVLKNGMPERIPVQTGISDGSYTEIVAGIRQEGREVIVESIDDGKKNTNTRPMPGFIR
ncbi:MAG: efflux RND transporter periplasmic adaptor subunit [Syntrophales bacterium]|jgi:HlyD family secretion protein|nr:efflux RND transporter periplasmic adaptor subunit [Syntrophales bacterium]